MSKKKKKDNAYANNANSGSLFKNESKDGDTHPDLTGYIIIDKDLLKTLSGKLESHTDMKDKEYKGAKLNIALWKAKDKKSTRKFGAAVSFYEKEQ